VSATSLSSLPVRYRDEWLLVVDKPSGIPTQPAPGRTDDVYTLLAASEPYVGLHHRLDQAASGLVMLTRQTDVNAAIAEGFRTHAIGRQYQAVLVGAAADATWDRPIDGKPAKTRVQLVGRGNGLSAVRLDLETGRTHQIRQHAAFAGRPIAGDRKYGGDAGRRWSRLALHAASLRFTHPVTGAAVEVTSPIPDDLAEIWARAGGA
jgi:23S rRNA pseudouridine1911/1915/1917 synthase